MRRFLLLLPLLFASGSLGCPFFNNPFGGGGSDDDNVTHEERDVSGTLAVALGGVADGADELVFDEDMSLLELTNEDDDLISLEMREGFSDYTTAKGARVVPLEEGIAYVTPTVNGRRRSPVEIMISPQRLIQILIGEARGELDREATLDDDGGVKSSSVSVTGDALGAVIRNRIDLINETASPGLFVADDDQYEADPPVSYYEAVIEANDGFVYQFSPVDPGDLSHDVYEAAAQRSDLDEAERVAYDQAVLTAAYIFNGDTEDPTGGAFAFYSPTSEEYDVLREALESQTNLLPDGGGTSDANFPSLAPIQVLVLEDVAPSQADSDVPSFVFVRSRGTLDAAVTDEP